ncbi:GAF domain-containing protein [Jannaschia sp. Os4]|uniref:GAF domain-containing protein n=1 Tax=Jannaschia sp. Os4 TaxID=2807617 RepID=UPI001939F99C|nr:GAF domain-containing protein [Jannaschia sp. Os4]MBM2578098.1 GAF domain-containing protein [Jannaschia sp. Os4]
MQPMLIEGNRGTGARRDEKATLRTLNAFAVDLMAIRSAEDLYWHVAREVVGRLGFVDCVVYRLDAPSGELVQVAALGEKNPYDRAILNPLRIPMGQGITGRCAERGEPVVADDLAEERDYIPDAAPARSEISVPILCGGRVVGILDSEHPRPHAFGAAELEVLTTVAAMTGAKLDLIREADLSARRYRDLVRSHDQLAEETGRRRSLEAELFEARRLEAIGRLTGGFAHAFNNLLTAVSGHLELAEAAGLAGESAEAVGEARSAAEAGAALIRDMLAFSRRSRLVPERVEVGDLVARAARLLPATARVRAGAADVRPVHIDPAAAEVALFNVLTNAAEATAAAGADAPVEVAATDVFVPAGGAPAGTDLVPGRYVRVDVADRGVGLADATAAQVFDPFFTTKPLARNSGLGLSMVKGFTRQSDGDVAIRANDGGPGVTVSLWLPVRGGETA